MALSRLSGRLSRIREAQRHAVANKPDKETAPVTSEALIRAGWNAGAPYLYERISLVPFPSFRESFSAHLPLLFPRESGELARLIAKSEISASLVFFDLETTGLSHGAGTVAFMAGIANFVSDGTVTGKSLRIHQILLADYPGEATFLARFIELVGTDPIFVSFNGKCFDSQILFTRFMMNGLRPAFIVSPVLHLDLLFPARRLWKKQLGSCRLSVVESEILGIWRTDDLPGSEAPEAWFDFVRSGATDRLVRIGDHNKDDCETLAHLLFALDETIDSASGRGALIRALDLRSRKDYQAAFLFLEPLALQGDSLALRFLAMDCEHRLRDLERALFFAEMLGEENRKRRIQNKIGKRDA